jgi:hypothetical protein
MVEGHSGSLIGFDDPAIMAPGFMIARIISTETRCRNAGFNLSSSTHKPKKDRNRASAERLLSIIRDCLAGSPTSPAEIKAPPSTFANS